MNPRIPARLAAGASAAALAWAVATPLMALPQNPVIFDTSGGVGPGATFTPGSGTLTITQTHDRVVIDWDSFDIGALETVTFNQGGDDFIAFNRIDPSAFTTIDGALNANGSVWLFSPGGILFGSGAQVNTGSFFAGLAELDDFQATEAMGLGDMTVFLNYGVASNPNTLTVDAGAQLFSNNGGFIVLQGAHIDQGGDVGGANQQVGYIVSEGGNLTWAPGTGSGLVLVNVDQTAHPSGRGQPYFNHTGSTSGAWIEIEAAVLVESNWETIINLDGVMDATGFKPTTTTGISIFGGVNSSAGPSTTGGTATVILSGDISSSGGAINVSASNIEVSGDVSTSGFGAFAYYSNEVTGTIDSAANVTIHTQGIGGTVDVSGTIDAVGNIDLSANRDNGYTSVTGQLTSDNTVNVRAKGDVYIGSSAVLTGNADDSAGALNFGVIVQAGLGFDFTNQTMNSIGAGDVTIASGAVIDASAVNNPARVFIGANNGDVDMAGDVTGSRVTLVASNDIVVSGDITASEAIQVLSWNTATPGIGGDIVVSGNLVADDTVSIWARYTGDVTIESGATVVSDADGAPTTNIFGAVGPDLVYMTADGFITIEDNTLVAGGYAGTDLVVIRSYGEDDTLNEIPTIEISGDIISSGGEIYSEYGSIRLNPGSTVTATTEGFSISAGTFVVIEAGAVVNGAGATDMGFPLLDIEEDVGIAILGADVAIAGDVYANNIIIGVRDLDANYVAYVGGVDDAVTYAGFDLGDDFRLSEAEIGNLHTPTLIIAAGADGLDVAVNGYNDIIVEDLALPSTIETFALGTSQDGAIVITGDVTPGNAQTEIVLGFASNAGPELDDRAFIPGTIAIIGSLGSEAEPFDIVTLHAYGDILMGTEEFVIEVNEDPEFNPSLPNDLEVDVGHIYIATGQLQLAAQGRIIQQNTAETPTDFSGIVFASPHVGHELIYAPDELEGFTVDGPNAWTVNFSQGPTRVQLFGVSTTENDPITGFEVGAQDHLLDPDIESNDSFTINSCQFGTSNCNPTGSSDVDPFESPTEMDFEELAEAEADQVAEDSEEAEDSEAPDSEDDSAFIRSLIAPGSDRAYEQERLGEPVTGSGNEDLWMGKRDGSQP